MRNIILTIAYDGSGFHGWQKQPRERTVQGVLEETLSRILGAEAKLEGTSRTDAGVHALGQCAGLKGDFGIPTDRIPLAANNKLTDVMILDAEDRPEDFRIRTEVRSKTYIYRFAVDPPMPVFLKNYTCLLAKRPNTGMMSEAAKHIIGTHDFACFQAAGGLLRESTVRTVFDIAISEGIETDPAGNNFEEIRIAVRGDGFLYNMVRIIAGTLAEAGLERIAPQEVEKIICSKDRARAGPTAPPQGLYLKEVEFRGEY